MPLAAIPGFRPPPNPIYRHQRATSPVSSLESSSPSLWSPCMPELKVTADHLKRDAYLYVRQSTLRQVAEHGESTQRQYALRDRAIAAGWPIERIHVIDRDLGKSGSDGFQQLVSEVALGKAGIVMGLEVSRLARNSADWHRLIELCALTATLILDEDGIYDPAGFNDRLLLGLKGTMSEAELHILKARMRGGQLNKARRGELEMGPPVGLVYRTDGTIGLYPDAQVQSAIRLVFETFERTGSAPSASSGNKACSSHADCGRAPTKVTSCGRHRSIPASSRCCTIRVIPVHSSMVARAPAIAPTVASASSRSRGRTGSSSCRACTRATSIGNGSRLISGASPTMPAPSVANGCPGRRARDRRCSRGACYVACAVNAWVCVTAASTAARSRSISARRVLCAVPERSVKRCLAR